MSEFVSSIGSAVCGFFSATGLISAGCYDRDAMRVLGTLSMSLTMVGIGTWALMRR